MATQKQFELVRNLLALAGSSFPAEAAAARKKADELILKYEITPADLAPPKPTPQRRCPGCPNCWPLEEVTIRMYAWYDSGATTTVGSSGTPLTRADLDSALNDLYDVVTAFRRQDGKDDRD